MSKTTNNNRQLPKGWEMKKLGEVCEFINGKAHEKIIDEKGKYIVINSKFISSDGKSYKWTNQQLMPLIEGDIVFVMSDVPNGKALAKCFLIDENHKYTLNQRIGLIRSDLFYKRYLYYHLNRHEYLLGFNNGENQTNLRKKDILNCPLVYPPLPEQKRIVSLLDRAFEQIDRAKAIAQQNLNNTKALFESYSKTLYENLISENKKEPLGNLAKLVRGPFGGSLKKSMFVDKGYAVYEQRNAIGDFTDSFRYFIDEKKFNEMERFSVKTGDMLMSCSGTIGKFTIVKENYTKGVINQALLKISPDTNIIDNRFLLFVLGNFIQNGRSYSKGAAIKNIIAVKELKKIEIPLLRIEEQKQIVDQLDNLQTETKKLEAVYQKKIANLEELKKSVLERAFRGEL